MDVGEGMLWRSKVEAMPFRSYIAATAGRPVQAGNVRSHRGTEIAEDVTESLF
jgi:hypothetical protein